MWHILYCILGKGPCPPYPSPQAPTSREFPFGPAPRHGRLGFGMRIEDWWVILIFIIF